MTSAVSKAPKRGISVPRTRRAALLGAVGLGLLLVGCAKPQAEQAERRIVVMGYRGLFEENFTKAFIEPYEKANPGVDIEFYGVEDSATQLGRLRAQRNAPQVDLVVTDISVAYVLQREDMLYAPKASELSNVAMLQKEGRELGLVAPPFTYDRLALAYNKAAFPTPPTSWNVLWDPAQSGKVVVPADGGGDIQALAFTFVVNRLAGGPGIEDVSPAIERLAKLAPSVQTWTPQPNQFALVANGTANLAVGWNARAKYRSDQAPDRLGFVIPNEGTVTQINTVSVLKTSKKLPEALAFENYMLSAEGQSRFSALMHYAPTNKDATPSPAAATQAETIPVNWLEVASRRRAILLQWRQKILAPGS